MMDDSERRILDRQEQHWQATLASRPETFGREASEPARRRALEFRAAGVYRILELGGGTIEDLIRACAAAKS